jgi:CRISPR-associated protein Csx10
MSEWHTFAIQITPNSPLHIGDESNVGNFLYTRVAIPGATLRGVIAARVLEACTQTQGEVDHAQCPDRDVCPFWQIFEDEQEPYFGFAYPGRRAPAYPFPLTARTCKLHPGYRTKDADAHGVHDVLIDQFVYNLLADPSFPGRDDLQLGLAGRWADLKTPMPDRCPTCQSPLTPPQGAYVRNDDGTPDHAGRLGVRRATHVGINRARAVAEDNLLYTQETIEPAEEGMAFYARVVVPRKQADALRGYLSNGYHVGRGCSRGLGSVKLSIYQEPTYNPADLRRRTADFALAVRATLGQYQVYDQRISLDLPGSLFTLTLRSPAILHAYGMPTLQATPELLKLPHTTLLCAWARPEVVTGWDAAAQLPRRTHLAVRAGSVFLYWVSPQLTEETLWQRLQEIELEGIGEERPRGYGQVTVCAPFHRHNRLGT